MTLTPNGDSAGRPRRHSSTTQTRPTCRRCATGRTLIRGRTFSPRPTTLWPLAEAVPLPGTALLAGWLGRTIVTLVTAYTRPGDRVLLLAPPAALRRRPPAPDWSSHSDCYAGLSEAVWTVIRLGRGVDSATAAPAPDHPDAPAVPTARNAVESGSGPRLIPHGPRPSTDHVDQSDRPTACTNHRPDGPFDLIITAVQPHDTDWLTHTDWDAILTPTGAIAAITHSDSQGSRLRDPVATIVNTLRVHGRRWHDHIAVLTQPLGDPTAATAHPSPVSPSPMERATASTTGPLPIRSVHHDLLLFGPNACATAETVERAGDTSDE